MLDIIYMNIFKKRQRAREWARIRKYGKEDINSKEYLLQKIKQINGKN